MSVHLFNAVIDLCVQKLNRNIGYMLGGEKITYMAFADDIVLFAESKEGLCVNVELLNNELRKAGFEANPGKCATISIGARKGKWFSDGKPFLKIDGAEVPAVPITGTYRYLGAQVGVKLEGSNPRKDITIGLERLSRAPLKPQQRFYLLREHFLPKFYHQLVLLEPTSKTLCALDYQIRSAAKRWLKVKQQCSSAFLYADIKDGGLGVPSLKFKIPMLKHQRMCRLIGANDTRTSMLIDQRDLAAPVVSGKTVSTSDSLVSIWRRSSTTQSTEKDYSFTGMSQRLTGGPENQPGS
ncbi:hypothetical protein EB796_025253 [Bugula neritina]|uniref:Reverse transcriptase domain-containing protein n=1 Tax=Bugula neritina TaxID=10212 RepID=A0A7J7IRB9_BUGNE|nr:hypothetical protein EB796_025253 [Bugula neritina]